VLSIAVKRGERGPDNSNQDGIGNEVVLAELDGRYLSTEVVGGILGRTIGTYAEEARLPGIGSSTPALTIRPGAKRCLLHA
jgi:hypothetical protein